MYFLIDKYQLSPIDRASQGLFITRTLSVGLRPSAAQWDALGPVAR